jgi:hypothetical protein
MSASISSGKSVSWNGNQSCTKTTVLLGCAVNQAIYSPNAMLFLRCAPVGELNFYLINDQMFRFSLA